MAAVTLHVSLSKKQLALISREVESGLYASAGEIVREALRQWIQDRIQADLAELEQAHAGAWERDTTPGEDDLILQAKREARAELSAQRKARETTKNGKGRR